MEEKTSKQRPHREKPAKITKIIEIKNKLGLHARATALFVKVASRFKSEIEIATQRERANGKSIMGLLTLAASKGTSLTIEATGQDAKEAIDALCELVENRFGESQ